MSEDKKEDEQSEKEKKIRKLMLLLNVVLSLIFFVFVVVSVWQGAVMEYRKLCIDVVKSHACSVTHSPSMAEYYRDLFESIFKG